MSLFQNSVLNSIKQDESLVALRWAAFQNYISKIDAIRGFKEEVYQDGFFKDIFESCLGYTLKTTNPSNYNLEREKKNETLKTNGCHFSRTIKKQFLNSKNRSLVPTFQVGMQTDTVHSHSGEWERVEKTQ